MTKAPEARRPFPAVPGKLGGRHRSDQPWRERAGVDQKHSVAPEAVGNSSSRLPRPSTDPSTNSSKRKMAAHSVGHSLVFRLAERGVNKIDGSSLDARSALDRYRFDAARYFVRQPYGDAHRPQV